MQLSVENPQKCLVWSYTHAHTHVHARRQPQNAAHHIVQNAGADCTDFGRLSEFNWGYGLLKFGRGDNSVYLHKETQGGFVRKGDDLIWGPLGHNFSKIMGDNFHIKENFTLLPNYLHTHTHTHTFLWILIITPLFC